MHGVLSECSTASSTAIKKAGKPGVSEAGEEGQEWVRQAHKYSRVRNKQVRAELSR